MQALHWAVYVLIVTTFSLWCSSALCLRVLVLAFVAIRAVSTQEICKSLLSGNCTYGNECKYQHPEAESRAAPK